MLTQEVSLLVVGLFAVVSGIRVDWNTNQGPIVPPTPRTTVRPVMPYREPAPVWEDQSNDIPNPNPYVYVAPPPSRPRYNDNNNNNYNNNNNINYGVLVAPGAASSNNGLNTHYRASVSTVAGLAPKYVPGVGIQYYGIVPAHKALPSVNNSKANESNRGYYGDKIQGKYNAKTKKYKAYEKVKAYGELNQQQQQSNNYNNNNNNQQDDKGQLTATATAQSAPPITSPSVLQLALEEQQLPEVQTARQFHTENTTIKTSLPLPSPSSKSSSSSSKSSWSHKKGHGGDKYWHKSTYYTHLLNSIQS